MASQNNEQNTNKFEMQINVSHRQKKNTEPTKPVAINLSMRLRYALTETTSETNTIPNGCFVILKKTQHKGLM